MSAPNITAKAGAVVINPRPANDEIIMAVAVLLCKIAVTPTPTHKARNRLATLLLIAWRNPPPYARVTPVLTIRIPHRSKATEPIRLIRT